MTVLKQLAQEGQSIWYDYIQRELLTSGRLADLVRQGLRGVTSNPAIFEKAIAGSNDYDTAMKAFVDSEATAEQVYESLAVEDIRMAADILQPVYDDTLGADGFVSLEVSPELANDTDGTVAEAKRLFETVARPNVMIKVPATPAGIPAIERLIEAGVNVNVTLIFSVENYQEVAGAYLAGLEALMQAGPAVAGGLGIDRVASVASFFVSRVDTAVDEKLKEKGETGLQGKIAIANSRIAYALFEDIFSGPRWEALAQKGARVQRLLWASTGTKNPDYPDTLYVDELIGSATVNTLPPDTLERFLDHGRVSATLTAGVDRAREQVEHLNSLGIDLPEVTRILQEEGVAAFARPFRSLLETIDRKLGQLRYLENSFRTESPGYERGVERILDRLENERIVERIWEHDHTVWKESPEEISNRLGWLHSPENMARAIEEIEGFVEDVRSAGFTHALLLGMGGEQPRTGGVPIYIRRGGWISRPCRTRQYGPGGRAGGPRPDRSGPHAFHRVDQVGRNHRNVLFYEVFLQRDAGRSRFREGR